jgi:predicted amidohydrolase YtcJ
MVSLISRLSDMKILYNALVYTLQAEQPRASALLLDGERIVAVGGEALLEAGGAAEKQDMGGRVILPGLMDAHFHLQRYALQRQRLDCATETKAECLRRVAERARQTLPGEWVLGHGWDHHLWPDAAGQWPTAADLDRVAPLHPVYLTAKSLHAGWVNTLALRKAKLRASTPNPKGGVIQRDPRGNPSGILFENALRLVERVIPAPAPEALAQAIHLALPSLWQLGLTGLHDFDPGTCLRALQILQQRGDLRLRVLKAIPASDLDDVLLCRLREGMGDYFLRLGPVKLFADGALGSRTAALLDSYVDEPQNRGILFLTAEDILEYGLRAAQGGFSLAVHAIGDGANRLVLDGFHRLRAYEREHHLPWRRHRLEHVQLIHPDDAPRLAEAGLVASMQPIHALSDMEMAIQLLGERPLVAYGWRTQLRHGARLAFGSDAPVESPNPFLGVYAAVTRRRRDGYPAPQGWHPEERLTVAEALVAYTQGPAWAAGWEDCLGRLAPGYLADLIVLETDPFVCAPEALASLQPVATMVGGSWVWEK